MLKKIRRFVKEHKMIEAGDTIVTGVSGGADSVCLLLILGELVKEFAANLYVVNVEHGIRGAQSEADTAFVQALCEKHQIPYEIVHVSAPEYAKKMKYTEEEAGRYLRYEAFNRAAAKFKKAKIAVAHHQNDQAETMLFHMVRGSALRGAGGMQPIQGQIIRPLLCVSRNEIEAYLTQRQQSYCIDQTNEDVKYTRNKMRHEVLPILTEINGQAVEHLCQMGAQLQEAWQYVAVQAAQALQQCQSIKDGKRMVSIEKCGEYPRFLQQTMVQLLLEQMAGSAKDLTSKHVEAIIDLMDGQTGRQISLPYELKAYRQYEMLVIEKNDAENEKKYHLENDEELRIEAPGTYLLENGQKIVVSVYDFDGKIDEIPRNRYTKCFDYDKIKNSLQMRKRKSGDFFVIHENGKKQKLKDYLINEKIPRELRDKIPVIAEGNLVLWLVGYRSSEEYHITAKTKRILEFYLMEEEV